MSRELNDFSAQIDEQFDLAYADTNSFWFLLLSLFSR